MVLGGNQIYRTDIEILDISKEQSVCRKPIDFPQEHAKGAVGTFYKGNTILCGGEVAGRICHQHNFIDHEWIKAPFTMTTERSRAGGVLLVNDSWIVLGGKGYNGAPLSTVEIMTDELFAKSILWPEAVSGHCMKAVNSSHIFIAGGEGNLGFLGTTYFLNSHTSHFHQVERQMKIPRSGHVCGFAKANDDEFAVIAGGFGSLKVELLSLITLKWKEGPDLPHELNWAASSMKDNAMVILGGEHIGYCSKAYLCDSTNSIYKLIIEENRWEIQSQPLSLPRAKHVVIKIPESLKICQSICPNCSG